METKNVAIRKIIADSYSATVNDRIVNESPLQIMITYGNTTERKTENLSVTMRTQGDDFNLVRGFLFCEGIIKKSSDVISMKHIGTPEGTPDENMLLVELAPHVSFSGTDKKRNFIASSACGFCGKSGSDITSQQNVSASAYNEVKVKASIIYKLPSLLQSSQGLFNTTGGAHAVALSNTEGEIIYISEDVGRHNAMDKMVGAMLTQNALPLKNNIVLFSGRLSYELVQKSLAAGIPIVCAIGAPTTLAIELAEENAMTVIGFLKSKSFNIYCGAQRIIQL
jgi:FdhD protein